MSVTTDEAFLCSAIVCCVHTKEMKIFFSGTSKPSQALGAIAPLFGGVVLVKMIGGIYCFCFVAQMPMLFAVIICNGDKGDALGVDGYIFKCNLVKKFITGIFVTIYSFGIAFTMLVCSILTAMITHCGDCCKEGCNRGNVVAVVKRVLKQ